MNQWDEAARQAAERINAGFSCYNDPDIMTDYIAKSHADLRATYEKLVELAINVDTLNMCPEEANCGKCNRVYELLANPLVQTAIEKKNDKERGA